MSYEIVGSKAAGADPAQSAVRLLTITWNVGNAETNPKQYKHLIPERGEGYDLVVLGLQESTYTIGAKGGEEPAAPKEEPAASGAGGTSSMLLPCVEHLTKQLCEHLGGQFNLVAHNRRAQLQLFIFGRKELQSRISNIEKSGENTGFLHVFPNKGGIIVTLNIDETSLAFISCHLAAHEGVFNCYMRNDSVKEILGAAKAGKQKELDIPSQFHHVFFMGDMNYRLTFDPSEPNASYEETKKVLIEQKKKKMEEKKAADAAASAKNQPAAAAAAVADAEVAEEDVELLVSGEGSKDPAGFGAPVVTDKEKRIQEHSTFLEYIVEENWSALLERDELTREVAKGRLLPGFEALSPAFPPTFKRYRGKAGGPNKCIQKMETIGVCPKKFALASESNSEMNPDSEGPCVDNYYNPQRYPAFTDRILHKSLPALKSNLRNVFFDSCELLDTSDHKPVAAGFELTTHCPSKEIKVHVNSDGANTLTFQLSNMKCKNLSELDLAMFGGGSDPYVVLSTDPMEIIDRSSKLKSSMITHNLNPDWGKETMEVKLVSNDLKGLSSHCHLIVQLWDKDTVTEDDVIGVCVIPLKDIIEGTGAGTATLKDYAVTQELFHGGESHGVFECTFKCMDEPNDVVPAANAPMKKSMSAGKSRGSFGSMRSMVSEDQEMTLQEYLRYQKEGGAGCCCTIC